MELQATAAKQQAVLTETANRILATSRAIEAETTRMLSALAGVPAQEPKTEQAPPPSAIVPTLKEALDTLDRIHGALINELAQIL